MANDSNESEENIIERFIEAGTDIAGSTLSTVVGLVVAGPPGALIGAASGPIFTHTIKGILSEFKSRRLGKREEKRIGATVIYAIDKIEENLKSGKTPRVDDFFESKTDERPPSEEIYEGTLLAAQREHEEKKIKYYGNLLGNLGFNTFLDKAQANLLLKVGQDLTYRQLSILSLINQKDRFPLRQSNYRGQSMTDTKLILLLQEITNLYNRGLIHGSGYNLNSAYETIPSKIGIHGTGTLLHNLMELQTIPEEELKSITKILM